jgi:hypothetical protein
MLARYLSDPQKHEKIGCGLSTTNAKTSQAEPIMEMKKKIRAIIPKASGGGANQEKDQ